MALDDEEFGLSLDPQPVAAATEPKKAAEPEPVEQAPKAAEQPEPVAQPEPAVAAAPKELPAKALSKPVAEEETPAVAPAKPVAAESAAAAAPTSSGATPAAELSDRIAARIRRFGVLTKEAKVTKTKTSLQARAERFGLKGEDKKPAAKSGSAGKKGKGKIKMTVPPEELAKLEARKRRFASAEDQKMAARAARFGTQA
eukprot:scaffold301_cov243-Pinguiococcus_pyrenoidosus.AAC.85